MLWVRHMESVLVLAFERLPKGFDAVGLDNDFDELVGPMRYRRSISD